MDRVACVNIPSLALQLLLKRHPEWHVYPVVVVDQDKPQGFVLQANHHARRQHISPGMRYAAGLSLAVDLRAGTLESHDIDPVCENFRTMLYEHTISHSNNASTWKHSVSIDSAHFSIYPRTVSGSVSVSSCSDCIDGHGESKVSRFNVTR